MSCPLSFVPEEVLLKRTYPGSVSVRSHLHLSQWVSMTPELPAATLHTNINTYILLVRIFSTCTALHYIIHTISTTLSQSITTVWLIFFGFLYIHFYLTNSSIQMFFCLLSEIPTLRSYLSSISPFPFNSL